MHQKFLRLRRYQEIRALGIQSLVLALIVVLGFVLYSIFGNALLVCLCSIALFFSWKACSKVLDIQSVPFLTNPNRCDFSTEDAFVFFLLSRNFQMGRIRMGMTPVEIEAIINEALKRAFSDKDVFCRWNLVLHKDAKSSNAEEAHEEYASMIDESSVPSKEGALFFRRGKLYDWVVIQLISMNERYLARWY